MAFAFTTLGKLEAFLKENRIKLSVEYSAASGRYVATLGDYEDTMLFGASSGESFKEAVEKAIARIVPSKLYVRDRHRYS